ncbi:MAG: HEPN family nuclease [Candidatus Cloacimonadota bacterium]|nr:HEPN family nuclease [Candidatus Cloacimonadota bacterium]
MGAMNNYPIDIIKRTKEILEENYDFFQVKDREATFLLNCLLGLIVTISENEKKEKKVFKGNIDKDFLTLVPEKVGFIESKSVKDLTDTGVSELCLQVRHREHLKGQSQFWFITKIRNGIAHQNIEALNENDDLVGIRLWNTNNAFKKDFEIIFTIEELKTLSNALSEKYLSQENT